MKPIGEAGLRIFQKKSNLNFSIKFLPWKLPYTLEEMDHLPACRCVLPKADQKGKTALMMLGVTCDQSGDGQKWVIPKRL